MTNWLHLTIRDKNRQMFKKRSLVLATLEWCFCCCHLFCEICKKTRLISPLYVVVVQLCTLHSHLTDLRWMCGFVLIGLPIMLIDDIKYHLPKEWHTMDIYNQRYDTFQVQTFPQEYYDIANKALGGNYYNFIFGIYKLQNPHLYMKYMYKKHEYEQRGPCEVMHLFHDTPSQNIDSIAAYNIDWRHGERFMYGPGVYFSVSPYLANKHSFKGSLDRAMFVCDVLVQSVQKVDSHIFLPDYGYDTVLAHNDCTYVKYFDCEYYPSYFIHYYAREY